MKEASPERGQKVMVKCWNGEVRENVVWESGAGMVYVCSQRQYSALVEGREAPPPIGFLAEDVEMVA
jgi:hypothetical protein